MTEKQLGMLAAGGSAVLLLAAFIFQTLGYARCASGSGILTPLPSLLARF